MATTNTQSKSTTSKTNTPKKDWKICVVGLGYVGLPLAAHLGRHFTTYGLDMKAKKIEELKSGFDSMNEMTSEELKLSTKLEYTNDPSVIRECNLIIVAVPTPIDNANRPDISLLEKASEMIGRYIQKGTIVVYESTVYPGCTEEDCVPVIENISGLRYKEDFFAGYSPERINPGDKLHTIDKIVKVVAGCTPEITDQLAEVYGTIVHAGIHKTNNLKVAEAAKVIENTQRDLNIGLMNELAIIFEKMDIPTGEVLEAAGTKWNFLKFTPGLVGGHCIGVDPYYLVHKAQLVGHHSQIVTAGRKINDDMPRWVASVIIKMLIAQGKAIKGTKILIKGLTFKEDVNDFRNSKAKELIKELKEFGIHVDAYDPHLTKEEVLLGFGVENIELDKASGYDGIILATGHKKFEEIPLKRLREICSDDPIFYDIRNYYDSQKITELGFVYKSL